MAFCSKCGSSLVDGAKFCPFCGTSVQAENATAPVTGTAIHSVPAKKTQTINVGQLVWSIISLLICFTPLGIAALVCTILAYDATDDATEEKYLKVAKTCNIIATVIGVISFIFGLIVGFLEIGFVLDFLENCI